MLGDLLPQRTPGEFASRVFGRSAFQDTVPPDALRVLADLPALQGAESLLGVARGPVSSWRPEPWLPRRGPVEGEQALAEYQAGCSLYFERLEAAIPELTRICRQIQRELGVPAHSVSVQGFASRAGHGVDLHFDHDDNFNLQLRGRKVWRVGPNDLVRHPVRGAFWGPAFFAEVGSAGGEPPRPPLCELRTAPGSLMYVPRGFWHATSCVDDSLAISFVVRPPYAFEHVLDVLHRRLLSDPEARAFVLGGNAGDGQGDARGVIEKARTAAMAALAAEDFFAPADVKRASPARTLVGGCFRACPPAEADGRGTGDGWTMARVDGGRVPLRPALRWASTLHGLLEAEAFVLDADLARTHGCSLAELEPLVAELVQRGVVERLA